MVFWTSVTNYVWMPNACMWLRKQLLLSPQMISVQVSITYRFVHCRQWLSRIDLDSPLDNLNDSLNPNWLQPFFRVNMLNRVGLIHTPYLCDLRHRLWKWSEIHQKLKQTMIKKWDEFYCRFFTLILPTPIWSSCNSHSRCNHGMRHAVFSRKVRSQNRNNLLRERNVDTINFNSKLI